MGIARCSPFGGVMSDYGELKEILLGHLTRQAPSMVTEGGVDMVGLAIRSAVNHLQRSNDFEWCKQTVSVQCDPTGNINNALSYEQGLQGKPVRVKRIIQAYGAVPPKLIGSPQVMYFSKTSQVTDDTTGPNVYTNTMRVIHSAQNVYLSPLPEGPYKLYFEAVCLLPKLVHDSDTNFLFEFGFDYLTYKSIQALNFYIKEDERFEINMALLKQAEAGLMQWDVSLLSPTETEIDL